MSSWMSGLNSLGSCSLKAQHRSVVTVSYQWWIGQSIQLTKCQIWPCGKCSEGRSCLNLCAFSWQRLDWQHWRLSPCSGTRSQQSRTRWKRSWLMTPSSETQWLSKSLLWLRWQQCGRSVPPCRSITPIGEPRWKKIPLRYRRSQAMITQSSVNSLWLLIQMCWCLLTESHIASWSSGSNVTSWCMVQSRSTR